MQSSVFNRAMIRVADTTEVSGRVTADSIKHELYANKQNNLWRLMCILAAVTLIPALAHAQNNQGNGPTPIPGVGFTIFTDGGYLSPPTPGIITPTPLAAASWTQNFPNGTSVGVVTFSIGGVISTRVTLSGTFTINPDGSMSSTVQQTSPPGFLLHFIGYPLPDNSLNAFIGTDPGGNVTGYNILGHGSVQNITLATLKGTYVSAEEGFLTDAQGNQQPFSVAGHEFINGDGSAHGTVSYSIQGQIQQETNYTATFELVGDGSVYKTATTTQGLVTHYYLYPTPDGNYIASVQSDAGSTLCGVFTRSQNQQNQQ